MAMLVHGPVQAEAGEVICRTGVFQKSRNGLQQGMGKVEAGLFNSSLWLNPPLQRESRKTRNEQRAVLQKS